MNILPLDPELAEYLKRRELLKKFKKQKAFFEQNYLYPSLHTELLEPPSIVIFTNRADFAIVAPMQHVRARA